MSEITQRFGGGRHRVGDRPHTSGTLPPLRERMREAATRAASVALSEITNEYAVLPVWSVMFAGEESLEHVPFGAVDQIHLTGHIGPDYDELTVLRTLARFATVLGAESSEWDDEATGDRYCEVTGDVDGIAVKVWGCVGRGEGPRHPSLVQKVSER